MCICKLEDIRLYRKLEGISKDILTLSYNVDRRVYETFILHKEAIDILIRHNKSLDECYYILDTEQRRIHYYIIN